MAQERSASALTPADEHLIACVREGLYDAEIAVRLGVPTGQVRERIERIVVRLGLTGRRDLRSWAGELPADGDSLAADVQLPVAPWLPPWRRPLAILAPVLLLIVAAAGYFALERDSSNPNVAPLSAATGGNATSPGFQPTLSVVDGRIIEDAGQLLFPAEGSASPFSSISVRENGAVLHLSGAGVIRFESDVVQWEWDHGSSYGATLVGQLGSRRLYLRVDVSILTTRLLPGVDGALGVYSQEHGDDPTVLLRVSDRAGRDYPIVVNDGGRLFVARDPVPGDAVVSQWSGERLDVSRAVAMPALTVAMDGFYYNACNDGSQNCNVIYKTDALEALRAPIDGHLTCLPSGLLELTGAGMRIRFEPFEIVIGEPLAPICAPPAISDVTAGTSIAQPGYYFITAFTSAGQRLSVATARDGTMYIGEFRPTLGCPCWRGLDQQ
jgi:DNA-binding CsgD family transcriptional regulator